jgi:membrane protease YdiL (CAAX protease family)
MYVWAVVPQQPWKTEGVMRLLLSVFVCTYAGSLLASVVHFLRVGGAADPKWVLPLAALAFGCLLTALVLVSKPWRFEDVMRRLMWLLAFFYAGMAAGAWAQKLAGMAGTSVAQMVISALSFQGAAVLLAARLAREHGVSWREAFGLGNQWRHALVVGVVLACVFLPVGWGLQQLSAIVLSRLPHVDQPTEQQAVQALRIASAWSDRAVLGVITILLAPLAEEVLFRGILYSWIKHAGFPRLALWGTAAVFAAIHMNLMILVPLFVLAVVLTVLYERTGNLLAPVVTHSLFNALNFAMLYLVARH